MGGDNKKVIGKRSNKDWRCNEKRKMRFVQV
ncbi:hypothetical protein ES705_01607 [subsurface metagenome]